MTVTPEKDVGVVSVPASKGFCKAIIWACLTLMFLATVAAVALLMYGVLFV